MEPYDDLSMNKVLDAHWGILNDDDVRYPLASHLSFSVLSVIELQLMAEHLIPKKERLDKRAIGFLISEKNVSLRDNTVM